MLFPGSYQDHPERRDVVIFYYRRKEFSDHFQSLLSRKEVYFEAYDPIDGDNRYCIAVYRKNRKEAIQAHENTLSALKKPFISDRTARLFLVGFFLLLLAVAIAGAIVKNNNG